MFDDARAALPSARAHRPGAVDVETWAVFLETTWSRPYRRRCSRRWRHRFRIPDTAALSRIEAGEGWTRAARGGRWTQRGGTRGRHKTRDGRFPVVRTTAGAARTGPSDVDRPCSLRAVVALCTCHRAHG